MSDRLVMCLAVSFLQNPLQHVQVLGNTDFLLARVENLPGISADIDGQQFAVSGVVSQNLFCHYQYCIIVLFSFVTTLSAVVINNGNKHIVLNNSSFTVNLLLYPVFMVCNWLSNNFVAN